MIVRDLVRQLESLRERAGLPVDDTATILLSVTRATYIAWRDETRVPGSIREPLLRSTVARLEYALDQGLLPMTDQTRSKTAIEARHSVLRNLKDTKV